MYIYSLFSFYNLLHIKKEKGWEEKNIEDYNSNAVLDQLSSGGAAAVYVEEKWWMTGK